MNLPSFKYLLPFAFAVALALPAVSAAQPGHEDDGVVVTAASDQLTPAGNRDHRKGHRGRGHARKHRRHDHYDRHHRHRSRHHWRRHHRQPPVIWRHFGHRHHRHHPRGRFELRFYLDDRH